MADFYPDIIEFRIVEAKPPASSSLRDAPKPDEAQKTY